MRTRTFLSLVLAIFLFAACEEKCDDPDISAINALYFELKQGGENGFSPEELNQVYFVRFIPFSNPLIADTLYPNGSYPGGVGKFFINNTYPFRNAQSPYFPVYGYMVIEPSSNYVDTIQNIDLGGRYDGDCGYDNILKTYTINSDSVDMSGSQAYYLLTK